MNKCRPAYKDDKWKGHLNKAHKNTLGSKKIHDIQNHKGYIFF